MATVGQKKLPRETHRASVGPDHDDVAT